MSAAFRESWWTSLFKRFSSPCFLSTSTGVFCQPSLVLSVNTKLAFLLGVHTIFPFLPWAHWQGTGAYV